MIIRHTYKYIKDGVTRYLCNTDLKPSEKVILDIEVLNSDEGKILVNKITEEKMYSIPLVNGDVIDNYYEIEDVNNGE